MYIRLAQWTQHLTTETVIASLIPTGGNFNVLPDLFLEALMLNFDTLCTIQRHWFLRYWQVILKTFTVVFAVTF